MNTPRRNLAARAALMVATVVILVFLALPIIVVVVTSFGSDALGAFPPESWSLRWYAEIFGAGSQWPSAIALSALVAALTTAFSVLLAMLAASALTRGDLPLRSVVYGLVLAPLIVPQIVTALGLFLVFEPAAMLGSPIAIALGHTVLAVPVAVLILVATFRGIDERLEDAAASMGAGRITIARRILFPLAAPGAIAAAVFSFITSFDEFFVAQFLSSVETQTLPVRIFNALEFDVDPTVTAISALLIGFALLALVLVGLARWLGGHRAVDLLATEETGKKLS